MSDFDWSTGKDGRDGLHGKVIFDQISTLTCIYISVPRTPKNCFISEGKSG